VPVSISYEYDPCDVAKGRELYKSAQHGIYEKKGSEDVDSIVAGISGQKGHVHLSFGSMIQGDFVNAEQVALEVDRQIVDKYVLHPSNFFAYKALFGEIPSEFSSEQQLPSGNVLRRKETAFLARVHSYPSELQEIVLKMYANPILRKEEVKKTLQPGIFESAEGCSRKDYSDAKAGI
jgi:hypothetical protein